jgi:hypothetical protein
MQTAVRTDLFGRDLTRLGEILNTVKGRPEDNLYNIKWDTNTKTMKFESKAPATYEEVGRNRAINDTLASLNKGLSGMANAAVGLGKTGTDVDGFVLEQLIAAGVPGLDQVSQMPSKVRNAIQNAYAQEAFKKAQGEIRRTKQDELYTNPTFRGDNAVPAPAANAVKTESIRPAPVMTRGRPSPMPPAELGPGE